MKHEWKKKEKLLYLPPCKPVAVDVPEFGFFSVSGKGNPNSAEFAEKIKALYMVSYILRMSYKWDSPPKGYYDYTVYPLEGIWDIADKSIHEDGKLDKDNLAYEIMIRQPDFITDELAEQVIEMTRIKKPGLIPEDLQFLKIADGHCVQMMHEGPYDTEPLSFAIMEKFTEDKNLRRLSNVHREIYISDARKTTPAGMKTVLRFKVEKNI